MNKSKMLYIIILFYFSYTKNGIQKRDSTRKYQKRERWERESGWKSETFPMLSFLKSKSVKTMVSSPKQFNQSGWKAKACYPLRGMTALRHRML